MEHAEHIDLVERYLSGQLSDAEKNQFEQDLKRDPFLLNLLQECQLARDAVNQQVEEQLRRKFVTWREESKEKKIRIFHPVFWAVAASLLLITTFYFIYRSSTFTPRELALSSYTAPALPESSMGDTDSLWAKGREAYHTGNLKQATEAWSKIIDSNDEMDFYLAHAYFQLGKYKEAAKLFQRVASGPSVYNYPSEWYQALSFLANDQIDYARITLQQMASSQSHPYAKDASQLLGQIAE